MEWDEEGNEIVVRRSGSFTSEDIHEKLFGSRHPKKRTVEEMKEGIRRYVRRRYARD